MRCPKCDFLMQVIVSEGVEIDRCTGCKGIWFDKGEAEDLAGKLLTSFINSELIDNGPPDETLRRDRQDTIPCPHCSIIMDRFFDIEGQQIQYEQCHTHGKFLDAGEFVIWAENHLG